MVNLDFILKIDEHWLNIKKWWENIKMSNELFPKNFKKINKEQKDIFKIKFLYFIKKIFDIEDLTKIDKININNYDINKLIDNFKLNFNIFKTFLEDDNEFKNIVCYILNFKDYFGLIKKKFAEIIEPLFNDLYFDKLFRCDNDLTRLFCPIGAQLIYSYMITRDVEKTIDLCLNYDNISVHFFVVSYLILDNFMDDEKYDHENKIIFFKWFMNIVNNPEKEIIINDKESEIWQCIIFKKYFILFREKYIVHENKLLYDFVKLMISTLKKTDVIQKNNDIDENVILECTFKKSYVTCFFMGLILIKDDLKRKNIDLLCKLSLLIQLYDDYFDIDKDVLENNYTYFNSHSFNFDFNEKVKKTILSSFLVMDDFNNDEKDKNVTKIFIYIVKYIFLFVTYIYIDKFDRNLINYFLDYSHYDYDILSYFDKESYDPYNSKIILNIFKKHILS